MDYRKIYNQLVDKNTKSNRRKGSIIYYEAHHIIPKCFGGTGDCRNINHPNIILLTTKEHYIAHLLLTFIYPTSVCMHKALWSMCIVNPNTHLRYKPGARMYKVIRDDYIKNCSGINAPAYGRKDTEEQRERKRERMKGKPSHMKNKKHKEDSKRKISETKLNKHSITSEETKEKLRKANLGGNHYNAKKIVDLKTNNIFDSGRELSEYLNIPFSTIRRWLNGTTKPPSHFYYRRQNSAVAYDQTH